MEEPDESHISLGLNLGTLKTWAIMSRALSGRAEGQEMRVLMHF